MVNKDIKYSIRECGYMARAGLELAKSNLVTSGKRIELIEDALWYASRIVDICEHNNTGQNFTTKSDSK